MMEMSPHIRGLLRVITYHRVNWPDESESLNPRLISASPLVFTRQMESLKKNYHILSMQQLLDFLFMGKKIPPRAALVTFDDGYADFMTFARPILRSMNIPATIFVPTAYPDHPERVFWWDELYAAIRQTRFKKIQFQGLPVMPVVTNAEKAIALEVIQNYYKTLPASTATFRKHDFFDRLGYQHKPVKSVLDWQELRQLSSEGFCIGAHTHTHPLLDKLPADKIRKEIVQSMDQLRVELGYCHSIFCVPNGNLNEIVKKMLEKEFVFLAFSTRDGFNDLAHCDLLNLARVNVTPRTTPFLFRMRLLRGSQYIDQWRHRNLHSAPNH